MANAPTIPAAAPERAGRHDRWRDARLAGEYDARRFGGPLGRWKQAHDARLLAGLLASLEGVERVLDLPAGTGRLFGALAGAGRSVVGADRAWEMLVAGAGSAGRPASSPPVARVQADARALPFRARAFDAVVSMRFLFHLQDPEERRAVLAEMARVAGRVVLVQTRARGNLKHAGRWLRARVGAARRYRPAPSRAALVAEFAAAGLEVRRIVPVARLWSDKVVVLAVPR